MLASSGAYLAGLLLLPAIIGFFAARLYRRRGWSRGDDPSWRRLLRTGASVLVGLYIFGQVAVFAVNGAKTTSPPTPMDRWVTNVFTPVAKKITSDLSNLTAAEQARSIPRVNDVCSTGVADTLVAWKRAHPPVKAFTAFYKTWLTDGFLSFNFCDRATYSVSFFKSPSGTSNWNRSLAFAARADSARQSMIKEGKKLGG